MGAPDSPQRGSPNSAARGARACLLRADPKGRAPDVAPPPQWHLDIWDGLRSLPRRELEAIVLRYVADLPVLEVATIMKIAPGTVASTLHDARAHLAVTLASEETPQRSTLTSAGPDESKDISDG